MSKSKLKNSLFIIGLGVIIFTITVLLERVFSIEIEFVNFIKGIGIGIMIGGAIGLISKRRKKGRDE